ncbi:hypothetical protein INT48_004743 [Thamnidium elegans]|uniref:Deoxycytidylate deaminase n=1 Tax=Thamnidium elegans TaxID=101142 RepID=A0A8H7SVQ4_9FUNG|nr:hypothetical protein INT48_004743 [Thamnidium elegans]
MFIGITGPTGSGRHLVAQYLVEVHGFKLLTLVEYDDIFDRQSLYDNATRFENVEEMQTYVTARWQENFVACDVDCRDLWTLKTQSMKKDTISLEEFLILDDRAKYNISSQDKEESLFRTPLYNIMVSSDLVITNIYRDKCSFYQALDRRDLTNKERLRPTWDTYFMQLSDLAAKRSNCMKRRVGCILTKDSRVIATGYNGTPRGLRNCNEGGCDRCNDGAPCGTGLDRCLCMHAEENALLEAGRGSVVYDNGVVLYCNTCPCLGCAIKIIQQGVKEVVYSRSYGMDQMTAKVFKEAGVKLRQHSPPSTVIELRTDVEEEISLLELK